MGLDDSLSVEQLNHPTHLRELAKTTMQMLNPSPELFLFLSRVEHSVICQKGLAWDKSVCRERSKEVQRLLPGLVLLILFLVAVAVLGWKGLEWVC